MAQEKSRRSLMLGEYDVRCNATPISSDTEMNRLLNTSKLIGSTAIGYLAMQSCAVLVFRAVVFMGCARAASL